MSTSNASAAAAMEHSPYPPTTAGPPSTSLDDPILTVFLTLFVFAATAHMFILQINLKRGKKFIMSGLMFGFCMARITACTMRLVWSTHPTNVSVAIAAQIFVAAGVLLLFIVNLVFAQRILREDHANAIYGACHPEFAWTKWFSLAFKLYYASIVVMLVALIICTVQSFYTLNHNAKRTDRIVQLVGATYFAVAAFLPIPLLRLNYLIPRKTKVEKFGTGRFRSKVLFLLFTSTILTLGAAFRAGIAYIPRPRADPAWYDSKACFYLFNFSIEIVVVYLYAIIRVDNRFHVPNGSKRPGDYSGVNKQQEDIDRVNSFTVRVLDEEDVFDGERPEHEGQSEARGPEADLEKNIAPHSEIFMSGNKRISNTLTLGGNTVRGSPIIEKTEDEIEDGYRPDSKSTSKALTLGGNTLGSWTPYSEMSPNEIDDGFMSKSQRAFRTSSQDDGEIGLASPQAANKAEK